MSEVVNIDKQYMKIEKLYYVTYRLVEKYNLLDMIPNFISKEKNAEILFDKIEVPFILSQNIFDGKIVCLIFYVKYRGLIRLSFSFNSKHKKIWINQELIENSNKWNIFKDIYLENEINEIVIELYNDRTNNYDLFIEKIQEYKFSNIFCSYFIINEKNNKLFMCTLCQSILNTNPNIEYLVLNKDTKIQENGKINQTMKIDISSYSNLIVCNSILSINMIKIYEFEQKIIYNFDMIEHKKLEKYVSNLNFSFIYDLICYIKKVDDLNTQNILYNNIRNNYENNMLNFIKREKNLYDFYMIGTMCYYSRYNVGLIIFYYSIPKYKKRKFSLIIILSSSMTKTYLEKFKGKYSDTYILVECTGLGSSAGNQISKKVILEIVEIMKKYFAVDENKISIIGYSANATTALALVAENQKTFLGCVCLGGIGNIYYHIEYSYVFFIYGEYDNRSCLKYADNIVESSHLKKIKILNSNHNLLQNFLYDFTYVDDYLKYCERNAKDKFLVSYKWFNNPLINNNPKVYNIEFSSKKKYGVIKKIGNHYEYENIKFINLSKKLKKNIERKIYYIFDNNFIIIYNDMKFSETAYSLSILKTFNEKNEIKCDIKVLLKNKINLFQRKSYILIGFTNKILFKNASVQVFDNCVFYDEHYTYGEYVVCQIIQHPFYFFENILLINTNKCSLLKKCFFTRGLFIPCSYTNDCIYDYKAIIYINGKYLFLK